MKPEYYPVFNKYYSLKSFGCPALLALSEKVGAKRQVAMSPWRRNFKFNSHSLRSIRFNYPAFSLMQDANYLLGCQFNTCVLNIYENENDHVKWHKDTYVDLDPDHPIAIVSYGAEREFWWKAEDQVGELLDSQKILLERGSLLFLPAKFNSQHKHCVPKHDELCGQRISLTFRRFLLK